MSYGTHNEQYRYAALINLYTAARDLYRAYTAKNRPIWVGAVYRSVAAILHAVKHEGAPL